MSPFIAKKMGDVLWIHSEGRTFTVDANHSSTASRKNAASLPTSGLLKSPMPGRILKILVNANSKTSVGQTVAIVEAMKMEYPIKATVEGTVSQIWKKPGDMVVLDEKILEIKKEDLKT